MRLSLDGFPLSPITCELLIRRDLQFSSIRYTIQIWSQGHRVCTFSRLFSDFQDSLALRNMTESCLTKGRSCFALRLIGQDKEMSVFFPHLSKAEHVRQTKKYPGNPSFPRFPAPCEAEHRRQPGRPHSAAFDHTGADSVSRLHLSKGRRHSPDVFCCPEWVTSD